MFPFARIVNISVVVLTPNNLDVPVRVEDATVRREFGVVVLIPRRPFFVRYIEALVKTSDGELTKNANPTPLLKYTSLPTLPKADVFVS